MCGIAGIISENSELVKSSALVAMADAMVHRGPDGEGYLVSNCAEELEIIKKQRPNAIVAAPQHRASVALTQRRLSILDLSISAGQPMQDATGRFWVVFNGEIYNHQKLRIELEDLGYKFNTDHSDTEVLLNAYACWGAECLQKLNGMWAFCIWDTKENTCFLARDRAGKKPLYYTQYNNTFYFASELKVLLVNKHIKRTIDKTAVYDFLTYMMVPAPRTIFENIFKLPAGHYLLLKDGKQVELKRYWTAFTDKPYLKGSEKEIADELRERIYEAARLRMLADVEVGVLLSGGIDSSVNLACLSKFATRPIKAFSVGFENKNGYTNELAYAEKTAKQFGAEYHPLVLSEKDFISFFPEMVYYQDEPIADTANIPIYYIAKTARENNVKVLLGGEGSDELFVGYELWRLSREFANIFENKPSMAALASGLHRNGPFAGKRAYYYGWYEKVKNSKPVFWSGTELRTEQEKQKMLSASTKHSLKNYSSFAPMEALYLEYKNKYAKDTYDWMTVADLQYRLPDLLLARLDRMLMAASVEGRNPFLDVNVMEYAMQVPPTLKTKGKVEKYILKKAFEGILPNEILYRKKDSFTVPMKHLLAQPGLFDICTEAISKFNKDTNFFDETYLSGLLKEKNGQELWNIANLAMWYEKNAL